MVLIVVRDGGLVSPVFAEPFFVFLSVRLMVCHLLKPVDMGLMMKEDDTLTYWRV